MTTEFLLPDLGEGLTESEIVAWRVTEGERVELNQVLAEVETAKAVVELPSPYAGTVARLHGDPGTVVQVGSPIVSFELDTHGGREPNLVGYGADPEQTSRPGRRPRRIPSAALTHGTRTSSQDRSHEPAHNAGGLPGATSLRPRSTPPVRKLAHDLGITLDGLEGSGPDGLIVREDVLRAAGSPGPDARGVQGTEGGVPGAETGVPGAGTGVPGAEAQAAPSSSSAAGKARETRTPIRGVRKHTAAAMVASAFTAPHVTEFLTVDITPTMELIAELRQEPSFAEVKLTPLAVVARAACLALRRSPELNSRWDEAAEEIIQFHYVNLGIAVAAPRGLLVPNIKDAHQLDLHGIAAAIGTLAETARTGTTQPADLGGGTISITNVGVFGVDAGTPILNPGEAAILATGAVRRMPWEYRGGIELRSVMTLSLSFDHRLVDGEQASRFLAGVGSVLASPGRALALI
jgi:2-oxoisovalerate dehydrogenase E2 component (dihydrolipoyl transacylase)